MGYGAEVNGWTMLRAMTSLVFDFLFSISFDFGCCNY